MALAQLQREFLASLSAGGDTAATLARLRASPAQPDGEQRLGVYVNAARAIGRDALSATFPVVEQLVGRAFFNEAADRYLASHPSTSGDLHELGLSFADFLGEYSHASNLPYLPDVARLEWAMQQAFHAADADQLDLARLATVPAEQWDELRFQAAPGTAIIASPWPLLTLWRAHQPGESLPDDFDLDQGGETVVVHREGFECVARQLDAPALAILAATLDGQPLSAALTDPAFNDVSAGTLLAALQLMINEGILVNFTLAGAAR